MTRHPEAVTAPLPKLAKCPTGIRGLDTITGGGLPRGRPTLGCGGSGSGKTLFGMEFSGPWRPPSTTSPAPACLSRRTRPRTWLPDVGSLGFDLPTT